MKLYTVYFEKDNGEIEGLNIAADDGDDVQKIAEDIMAMNYYGDASTIKVYDGIAIHGSGCMSYTLNSVSLGELKKRY